jgi:hypothetical protein
MSIAVVITGLIAAARWARQLSRLPTAPPEGYTPNHIPAEQRFVLIALAVGLLIYGLVGLLIDDLYIPGRRRQPGTHLHGGSAMAMFAAMALGVATAFVVVADHYDQRNNERNYKLLSRTLMTAAVICFGVAMALHK